MWEIRTASEYLHGLFQQTHIVFAHHSAYYFEKCLNIRFIARKTSQWSNPWIGAQMHNIFHYDRLLNNKHQTDKDHIMDAKNQVWSIKNESS